MDYVQFIAITLAAMISYVFFVGMTGTHHSEEIVGFEESYLIFEKINKMNPILLSQKFKVEKKYNKIVVGYKEILLVNIKLYTKGFCVNKTSVFWRMYPNNNCVVYESNIVINLLKISSNLDKIQIIYFDINNTNIQFYNPSKRIMFKCFISPINLKIFNKKIFLNKMGKLVVVRILVG